MEQLGASILGVFGARHQIAGHQIADMAADRGQVQPEDPAQLAGADAGLAGDQGQQVELGAIHLPHRGVASDRPEQVDHGSVESCLHQPTISEQCARRNRERQRIRRVVGSYAYPRGPLSRGARGRDSRVD